jgi:hypothetical protein
VLHLAFERTTLDKRGWMVLGGAIALFLAATVPYAITYRIWDRPDHAEAAAAVRNTTFLKHRFTLLLWNLRDLSTSMMLPAWLAVLAGLALFQRGRDPGSTGAGILKRAGLLLLVNLVVICLISPQPTHEAFFADVRYLVGLLSLTAIVGGLGLEWLHRRSRLAALAMFVLAATTTIPRATGCPGVGVPQPFAPATSATNSFARSLQPPPR